MYQPWLHSHQIITKMGLGPEYSNNSWQLTWQAKTSGLPNARTHEQCAWCVLCARACLPAPRGPTLPVRELVPVDYSRTSCWSPSSKWPTEYDRGLNAPAGEEFMLVIIWLRVESDATRILTVHRSA